MYVCACVPGARGDQKSASEPIELELQLGAAMWVPGLKPGSSRKVLWEPFWNNDTNKSRRKEMSWVGEARIGPERPGS